MKIRVGQNHIQRVLTQHGLSSPKHLMEEVRYGVVNLSHQSQHLGPMMSVSIPSPAPTTVGKLEMLRATSDFIFLNSILSPYVALSQFGGNCTSDPPSWSAQGISSRVSEL